MKIKTLWKGMLIALAVILAVGVLASFLIKAAPQAKPKEYDYSITYIRAETGEDILTNYDFMLKKSGSYPMGYNADSATFKISDLRGKMEPTPNSWGIGGYVGSEVGDPKDKQKSYAFYGWYLDKDCTVEFAGTVREGATGNIVLFAKIKQSSWV